MSTVPVVARTILKKSLGWSIALSVLMLLAGFLAIVVPPIVGIAVAVFVAWLLVQRRRPSGICMAHAHNRGNHLGAVAWAGLHHRGLLHPALSAGGPGVAHARTRHLSRCRRSARAHSVLPVAIHARRGLAAFRWHRDPHPRGHDLEDLAVE